MSMKIFEHDLGLIRIIVAFLTVLEKFADVVIGWLPLYGELKLALFIYMWYHKTKSWPSKFSKENELRRQWSCK
ncbi:putative HVA22 protein g [Trifolium repens]|nr:putative HVA22 protein g [Trifolium repens]